MSAPFSSLAAKMGNAAVVDLFSSDDDQAVEDFISKRRKTSDPVLPPAAPASSNVSAGQPKQPLHSSQIEWSSSPSFHSASLGQLMQRSQVRHQHTLTDPPDKSPFFPLYPDLDSQNNQPKLEPLEPELEQKLEAQAKRLQQAQKQPLDPNLERLEAQAKLLHEQKPQPQPQRKPQPQQKPQQQPQAKQERARSASSEVIIDLSQPGLVETEIPNSAEVDVKEQKTADARRDAEEMASLLQSITNPPQRPLEDRIAESLQNPLLEVAGAVRPHKEMKEIMLSDEQRYVLDLVVGQRKSVFFTGAAGTGKSVLLRRMISDLRRKFRTDKSKVAVTASTGIAACNVGGSTLHSFAGIGLGQEAVEKLVNRVKRSPRSLQKWRTTEVLVIDEISMIDAELLEKLDFLARKVRKNKQPFGGIQLILTGDFFQLPPVNKLGRSRFAFEAECWSTCVDRTIVLRKVFRQKDNHFANMLNEMRRGELRPETTAIFEGLSRTPLLPSGVQPTRLFPLRYQVQMANDNALKALRGQSVRYTAKDAYMDGNSPDNIQLDNLVCVPDLSLRVGAQVMMVKNVDETLVNGTLGKVIAFMSPTAFDVLARHQLIDLTDEELFKFSCESMGARKRAAQGQGVEPPISAREAAKISRADALTKIANRSGNVWPLVRFFMLDGTFRDVLVQPETWKIEDAEGNTLASRTQVPLVLAWALSIHKSQGQTLDWVTVDLGKTFECGQAYVALSRVTSIEGLQILNFRPEVVQAHFRVVRFYDGLEQIGDDHLRQGVQTTMFDFAKLKEPVPPPPPPPIKTGSARRALESSVIEDSSSQLSQGQGPGNYF